MELLLDTLVLTRVFGIKLINEGDFLELLARFIFNSAVCLFIVRAIYYPLAKKKEYLFTYLLFSVIVFFLCHLLSNVKLGLGFALGLFAIFGIIRYRTDAIPIKEMTYLFIVIGVSVINALANKKVSYAELVFTNVAIMGATYALERVWLLRHESVRIITYENIGLIKPDHHDQLLADLKERTGLNIHRLQIGKIDFLRDTASIKIYFYEDEGSSMTYEVEEPED